MYGSYSAVEGSISYGQYVTDLLVLDFWDGKNASRELYNGFSLSSQILPFAHLQGQIRLAISVETIRCLLD